MWFGSGVRGLVLAVLPVLRGFNLDGESPVGYGGPPGSYFGYSVEFYTPEAETPSVLIGAPKANTSQPNITEAGAVYTCPWGHNSSQCQQIPFDTTGNRMFVNETAAEIVRFNESESLELNNTELLEFKSHQWFGATIRSFNSTILACAPRYKWRTTSEQSQREPVGSCFLSIHNFSSIVEYAPCRSGQHTPMWKGYCQGSFSADMSESGRVVLGGPGSFFWQGQLVTARIEDIVKSEFSPNFIQYVEGQKETSHSDTSNDYSYLGFSVAIGEFTGDEIEDYVTGVPRGMKTIGYVTILNGTNLKSVYNFTGEQMTSYFGYSVAVSDINGDGLEDVLIGAPMLMVREVGGRLEELGRVYVYLQSSRLEFSPAQNLTGNFTYGRFGTAIAVLGDLDQDGYNDMAVGAPYAGEDARGIVYIYNGQEGGLGHTPSQTLLGLWPATDGIASFGFTVRGATDLDGNGYPDVIVGAFGVDQAVVYRARPIISASASLRLWPAVFNPEEKRCTINGSDVQVSCINVSFCLTASGKHIPDSIGLRVELGLDTLKVKGAIRRVLFLDTQQPGFQATVNMGNGQGEVCHHLDIYLREETEFRDKLSLIRVELGLSLDPQTPVDEHGLRPILSFSTARHLHQQAQIQLDCGEDNVCVPDLHLSVTGDVHTVYLGDRNSLSLSFEASNMGEGGAYEAELCVTVPPEADYSGIVRNESLAQLSCTYENQTVVCDLGNPMKPGTNLSGGLRFTVHQLSDQKKSIQFDLQIRSKNLNNSHSETVAHKLTVAVAANVSIRGVSIEDKINLPIPNWRPSKRPIAEEEVGPPLQHVFELSNNGPSSIGLSTLTIGFPSSFQGNLLLYPVAYSVSPTTVNCTSSSPFNPRQLKRLSTESPPTPPAHPEHTIRRRETPRDPLRAWNTLSCQHVDCQWLTCQVEQLERGQSVVLTLHTRVWVDTFLQRENHPFLLQCNASYTVHRMPYAILPLSYPQGSVQVVTSVLWGKLESSHGVPLWIIILAVLIGLLLLSLVIFILYKNGFFKRAAMPYGTTMEKAQLKPPATSEA